MKNSHIRDAVSLLRPQPDDRDGVLPPLLLILTVVTGLVDAYSYLELHRVLVANMTGNVVFLGFSWGGAAEFNPEASIVAVLAFLLGAFLGGRLGRLKSGEQAREKHLSRVAVIQAVLLVSAALMAWAYSPQNYTFVMYVLVIILGVAMGSQNAMARALAVPDLMTTVLTMTLAGLSADSSAAGGQGSRAGRRLMSVLTMFLGAILGSALCLHGHSALTLVLAGVLTAFTAVVSWRSVAVKA